jgi:hypothetical protein
VAKGQPQCQKNWGLGSWQPTTIYTNRNLYKNTGMQKTLFDDGFEKKKESSLKIVAKGQKPLSKNQQLFNKLTQRIERLEKDITQEEQKLAKLLKTHVKEIIPLQNKVANSRIQLAMTLEKAAGKFKFSKNQSEKLRDTIVGLCEEAFADIEPSPEQEAFYDKWSDISYKDEIDISKEEVKDVFSGFVNEMFGMDLNLNDFDDSPEGFAQFQEKLKEQFEQAQSRNQQQNRKKTKKQEIKEKTEKAEAELKNKSIRSIYITLAKILHPDTEQDNKLKAQKEEVLKKVTVAYEQKDLTTLLKLEMEWVHQTTEHLEQITDDRLKIYISALKQQVAELEQERINLHYHPRYASVSGYGHMQENYAMNEISIDKRELKGIFDNISHFIKSFEKPDAKKGITSFINDYCRGHELYEFDNFWI